MRERWSFEFCERLDAARGPERAARDALELLRPFQRHRPTEIERNHPKLKQYLNALTDEAIAFANIQSLAERYNYWTRLAASAPRAGQMFNELKGIRDQLQNVVHRVGRLDDLSLFHLSSGLDHIQILNSETGRFLGESRLAIRTITQTLNSLAAYYGSTAEQFEDKGGKQNHYERFFGNPKVQFVCDAFEFFEDYMPHTASSSEGSDFYLFVHLVFEFATGETDEDEAKLSHYLRSLITPLKERAAIDLRLSGIATELAIQSCDENLRARLLAEKAALGARRLRLLDHFFPLRRFAQPVAFGG